MDENNLSSLGLNFPPILVIKVMQVIAYMLTCIYCVTIINCTSSAVCSNPFDIIDVCHWNSLLDTKLSDLKTDRLNVIAYTMSVLFNYIRKEVNGYELDFMRIWNQQSLYPELIEQLVLLCTEVYSFITREDRLVENVTQWCKQARCWELAQNRAWVVYLTYKMNTYGNPMNQYKRGALPTPMEIRWISMKKSVENTCGNPTLCSAELV